MSAIEALNLDTLSVVTEQVPLLSSENRDRYSGINFKHALLTDFNTQFVNFLESDEGRLIAQEVNDFSSDVFSRYKPDQASLIVKSMMIGVVGHQSNLHEKKRRRKETNTEGARLPYSIHMLRMARRAMHDDLKYTYVAAQWIHDLREDVTLTFNQSADGDVLVEGEQWDAILKEEFDAQAYANRNWSQGELLVDIMNGVTPPRKFTADELSGIQESPFYLASINSILAGEVSKRISKGDDLKEIDIYDLKDKIMKEHGDDAIKSVGSILHAFEYPIQYRNDMDRYWEVMAGILVTKLNDIGDNVSDPENVSGPKQMRARVAAVCARLMDWDISTEILSKLATVMNIEDPTRPFSYRTDVSAFQRLARNTLRDREFIEHFTATYLQAEPLDIRPEVSVTLSDEQTNENVKPGFGLQYRVIVNERDSSEAIMHCQNLCHPIPVELDHEGLKLLGETDNSLHMQELLGITHRIQIAAGRKTGMFFFTDAITSKKLFFLKILDGKPTLKDLATEDSNVSWTDVPETCFFAPDFINPNNTSDVRSSILNRLSVLYDPETLAHESSAVVIYPADVEGGEKAQFVAVSDTVSLNEVSRKLGRNPHRYVATVYEGYEDEHTGSQPNSKPEIARSERIRDAMAHARELGEPQIIFMKRKK